MATDVKIFKTRAQFRAWLERNHARTLELWVGYYRKDAGKTAMTYPESLDEALCFGWIDGVRKKVDHEVYTNRFTPRKPGSIWSLVNVKHVNDVYTHHSLSKPAA